jgi:hypothetical protein
MTIKHRDTQYNGTPYSVILCCQYAECRKEDHYAECLYAECHYAVSRGAVLPKCYYVGHTRIVFLVQSGRYQVYLLTLTLKIRLIYFLYHSL